MKMPYIRIRPTYTTAQLSGPALQLTGSSWPEVANMTYTYIRTYIPLKRKFQWFMFCSSGYVFASYRGNVELRKYVNDRFYVYVRYVRTYVYHDRDFEMTIYVCTYTYIPSIS